MTKSLKDSVSKILLAITWPLMTAFSFVARFCSALTAFAGIAGVIWLLCLGEGGVLLYGLLGLGFGIIIVSLAMMPGMFLLGAFAWLSKISPFPLLSLLFGLLGAILFGLSLIVIGAVWCGGVFWFLWSLAKPDAYIPALLFACSVATAPWDRLIANEPGSLSVAMFRLGCVVACTVLLLNLLLFQMTFIDALILLSSVIGFSVLLTLFTILAEKLAGRDLLENFEMRASLKQSGITVFRNRVGLGR